jgi:glutamyl-tRNA(Gln) amidotransferase subunit E
MNRSADDYAALGLVAGIEIHQQLNTVSKLFCSCPTTIRDTGESSGEFFRYLRATRSELGELDRAAEEEMMQVRRFRYLQYDSTCLVENDEEPPSPLNREALDIVLVLAKLTGMTPVSEIHTMRKLVIDGSNTSGFQRTALIALHGSLPTGAVIETVCIEEEAAQRVEDAFFSLDRLGIPLIEITTAPCLNTPEAVQETAALIGMYLRSTGKVKRGIGTIRQDVNVSIRDGARVEIKGVQELDLLAEVVRREVRRQVRLLDIRDELVRRGATVENQPFDVTHLFKESGSRILKKAKMVLAIRLNRFAGLVGLEIQPGRRLGSEMSDYAKKCGVGGLFHTDELPAYGIAAGEVTALRQAVSAEDDDCVVIIADTPERCRCAAIQIIRRAEFALTGIPKETRKMLEEGSTAYMRPLPGAARMYPETDVLPVRISDEDWNALQLPELLTDRIERYMRDYTLNREVARQMAYSDRSQAFEEAVCAGIKPSIAERAFNSTLRELSRDEVRVGLISNAAIRETLDAVQAGKTAKEAIPAILTALAAGKNLDDVLADMAPAISSADLDAIVARIVDERIRFVRERGAAAAGPLMGVVMKEVRGSIDGKTVNQALQAAISKILEG